MLINDNLTFSCKSAIKLTQEMQIFFFLIIIALQLALQRKIGFGQGHGWFGYSEFGASSQFEVVVGFFFFFNFN